MLPEGFEKRMRALLGSEYDAFLQSLEAPVHTGLRLNPLKKADMSLLDRFCTGRIPWCPTGFFCDMTARPGLSVLHEAGLYYLQEPSAMAPAELLDVQPGQRVLDLCAAPGGKSTQLAGKMKGGGLLVCNEIHPKRAQILSSNLERLGVSNALVLNAHPGELARRFPEYFDRILVDAPCSGEGMFRKEQAAVDGWTEKTNESCASRQREILSCAAQMLKPGGRLVYSTCTFSPVENEGVISEFLLTHEDFSVVKIEGLPFSPGRPDWIVNPASGIEHTFRLWPHLLAGEGHYAAVLCRADGQAAHAPVAAEPEAPLPAALKEFCRASGAALPEGKAVLFGERVYLCPEQTPSLRGLRVLRAGLELGQLKKGRFEPAHAWAHWLEEAAQNVDFSASDEALRRYMAGNVLQGAQEGWALVRVEGLGLGWVKGSGGQLKNHYPKALRREGG